MLIYHSIIETITFNIIIIDNTIIINIIIKNNPTISIPTDKPPTKPYPYITIIFANNIYRFDNQFNY